MKFGFLMVLNNGCIKEYFLKTEMTILGVKTTKEAISADFNTMIADSKFELPKFPVKNINKLN